MKALAAAMLCALLVGCAAPLQSTTPSASPTPSELVFPGPTPTCHTADVAMSLGTWGYAAGTSGVDVHLTLRGSSPCSLPTQPALAILDAHGHVVLTLAAQDNRPITLTTTLRSSLALASWCNRPPPQQLTVRLQLNPVENASAPLPAGYKAACMGATTQLTLAPLTQPAAPSTFP